MFFFHVFFQATEKYAKKIVDMQLKAQFMQDINAISYAWSPAAAIRLKELFFLKYEHHPNPVVVDVTAHFKNEWCNARLGNWCSGHALNCVINTNGLESTSTNKVIKDELTYRQLMPVMDFLQRSLVWLQEQSEKRAEEPTESLSQLNTPSLQTIGQDLIHGGSTDPSRFDFCPKRIFMLQLHQE